MTGCSSYSKGMRLSAIPFLLALAVPGFAAAPGADEAGDAPLFREEVLTGISTLCGSTEKDYIIEVNGGGLVLGDFDSDGDVDLVVVDGSTLERADAGRPGNPPRLYLNDGSGRFAPAGGAWEMSGGQWGMGGTAGDVDGDGDLDLVVTQWGPDRLFLNRDGKGFEEATEKSGFRGTAWSTSAALLDYDGDGNLDLAVTSYLRFVTDEIASRETGTCNWKGHAVMCGPEGLTPIHDRLYRGVGDGTFADVSVLAKFRPQVAGYALGITTLDYDLDGDTDLYVTNDSTPNHLWENAGDGTFLEVGTFKSVGHDASGKEQAGMGIATGDLNGDGRPDLFVTNFSAENNALYLSTGELFRERSSRTRLGGPSRPYLGWGTAMHDFDHDGDLDLALFNGHVYPQADRPGTGTTYAQPDHFYRNDGSVRFEFSPLGDGPARVSRACATADVDGDGDLDIVSLSVEGDVRLLRNVGASGHWLRVQLRGRTGNTQALGALVTATWGDTKRTEEVRTAGGFQSAIPAEVHFGLGAADEVDLEIRWPSGKTQELKAVDADRVLVVEEPE